MVTQTITDMTTLAEAAPAKERAKAACVHHWVVRPPQGETSWGECRKCNRRRRFINHFEGRDRGNNSDIFASGSNSWKPDRRATYRDPGVSTAIA